jgi:hypothetical protein
MSRASRLAEIAKANQPAFSGTHWWLADPAAGDDSEPASAASVPAAAAVSDRLAVTVAGAVAKLSAISAPSVSSQRTPSRPVLSGQLQNVSQAVVKDESEQNQGHLGSRLSGLKEKFLWLGRKSRAVHQD